MTDDLYRQDDPLVKELEDVQKHTPDIPNSYGVLRALIASVPNPQVPDVQSARSGSSAPDNTRTSVMVGGLQGDPIGQQSQTSLGDVKSRQMIGPFERVDVPASVVANTPMALVGGPVSLYSDRPVAPWTGRITGISWRISAAPAAGSITLRPTEAGVERGPGVVIGVGSPTSGILTSLGPFDITAGHSIGIDIESSGTLSPTTLDVGAWLAVEWDG